MKELILSDLIAPGNQNSFLMDIREPDEFASGFITGSIFLSVNKIPEKKLKKIFGDNSSIVIIANDSVNAFESEQLIIQKTGIHPEGYYAWSAKDFEKMPSLLNMIIQVEPNEFLMDLRFDDKILPIDLRDISEYESEHLPKSKSIPLVGLSDLLQLATLDEGSNIYFYGEDDGESLTAASLLKSHGLDNVRIVNGGWQAICHDSYFKNLKKAIKGKKSTK